MASFQETLNSIERIRKIDEYLLDPEVVKDLLFNHPDFLTIKNSINNGTRKIILITYMSSGCLLRSIENSSEIIHDPPSQLNYFNLEEACKFNPNSNVIKNTNCENSFVIMIGTYLPTKMLGYENDATDIYCTTRFTLDILK